jgi:hypothetical protein
MPSPFARSRVRDARVQLHQLHEALVVDGEAAAAPVRLHHAADRSAARDVQHADQREQGEQDDGDDGHDHRDTSRVARAES